MVYMGVYIMTYRKIYSVVAKNATHSQLLEGLKCESQTENSGRTRSWGTLPGLQHYKGVEGHAGAPGWD